MGKPHITGLEIPRNPEFLNPLNPLNPFPMTPQFLSMISFVFYRNGEKSAWNEGYKTQDNDTFYHVTGLYPYSVYSFRILAENEFGVSEPGEASYYMFTLREGKKLQVLKLNHHPQTKWKLSGTNHPKAICF